MWICPETHIASVELSDYWEANKITCTIATVYVQLVENFNVRENVKPVATGADLQLSERGVSQAVDL